MQIAALVRNTGASHAVTVTTAGTSRSMPVPAKEAGSGSAVNGGEFLMLALATCYCNDLYREAMRLGIPIEGVEVEAAAEFDGIGLAARDIRYRARIESPASEGDIATLLHATDAVAEVHNTIRAGVRVSLVPWDALR